MSRTSDQPTPGDLTPQVVGQLVATRRVGDYHHLTFRAPGVAERAQPGQFVALAVGGETSANLLRRCFSIHKVRAGGTNSDAAGDPDIDASGKASGEASGQASGEADGEADGEATGDPDADSDGDLIGDTEGDVDGRTAGTVDVVVAARGPGTRWLTGLRAGAEVSVIGPLGRGFPLPADPVPCVLVGGGYGSAPLFWLAEALRERGCQVELVLGAATRARLFGVEISGAGGAVEGVTLTTDDGSAGTRGWVSAVLPDVIRRSRAQVVYGCGPMAMLRSVTELAAAGGAVAQVAVEESMACGVGVCMTCVLPVTGDDGLTRMVRSCVEGPVFRGDRIRWEAFQSRRCMVPDDAQGAAAMLGH